MDRSSGKSSFIIRIKKNQGVIFTKSSFSRVLYCIRYEDISTLGSHCFTRLLVQYVLTFFCNLSA